MDVHDFAALQTRLDRLEKKNHLLLWVLVGLLAISSFLFILSAAAQPEVQDVVRANSFEVVDADGTVLAKLGPGEKGSSGLALCDASGKLRAAIGITADGTNGLAVYDAGGTGRIVLSILSNGSTGLAVFDASENVRAAFGTLPDGSPKLQLIDAGGNDLFSAP